MYRYEYTRMKLTDLPVHVQQEYNIQAHAKNGYIYLEIWRSIYGLPTSRKISKKIPARQTLATWISRSESYPRTTETYILPN